MKYGNRIVMLLCNQPIQYNIKYIVVYKKQFNSVRITQNGLFLELLRFANKPRTEWGGRCSSFARIVHRIRTKESHY